MKNRLVQLERALHNRYPPCGNSIWDRNRGPQNQRLPVPLKPNNVVDHETMSWCHTCQDFMMKIHVQKPKGLEGRPKKQIMKILMSLIT
jgi:hypothetical protein